MDNSKLFHISLHHPIHDGLNDEEIITGWQCDRIHHSISACTRWHQRYGSNDLDESVHSSRKKYPGSLFSSRRGSLTVYEGQKPFFHIVCTLGMHYMVRNSKWYSSRTHFKHMMEEVMASPSHEFYRVKVYQPVVSRYALIPSQDNGLWHAIFCIHWLFPNVNSFLYETMQRVWEGNSITLHEGILVCSRQSRPSQY